VRDRNVGANALETASGLDVQNNGADGLASFFNI
jgi:hypothetical protein